jgi:ribosomal protein S18 acetylase RimI-like enzyme
MKLCSLFETRSQEEIHHNPSVATLKALARNNRYHSARFVITKDGDVVAGDSEHHTHHSMAPYMGAWDVRGYVQYMEDGSYAYRSMQVYSALNKDHPTFRIWERAGIENGNPDQSDLAEATSKTNKKSISTDAQPLNEALIQIIDQEDDEGGVEGYVVDTNQEQLRNYLSGQRVPKDLIDELQGRHTRIAIIKNVWVNEDQRGTGIGSRLMEAAIDDAASKGAEAVILLAQADDHQDQTKLVQWYQSYGFRSVGSTPSGYPVMVLDMAKDQLDEKWSKKYKKSINCANPKGFSQKAHCAGRRARRSHRPTKSRSINEQQQPLDLYGHWTRYTPQSIEADYQEYRSKLNSKWHKRAQDIGARWPLFSSMQDFKHALDHAVVVKIDQLDQYVNNLTMNDDLEDIKAMVSNYQQPRDVDRIVQAMQNGVLLPLPIILQGEDGLWIMAGNTRQAVSRVLGYEPQALLVDVRE